MTERSRSEAAADEQFSVSGTDQTAATPGASASTSYTTPETSYGSTTPSGTAGQAKEAVQGAADQAKQVAGDVAGQAREQATSQLSNQKEKAASSLGGVADALRQTGQTLNENEQSAVGNYVSQAADQVERLQGYLRDQDIGAIVDDVERMAREQPVMFLGGAFVLGLLSARFLKSTGQGGRYGSSYGRSRSYTSGGYGGSYGTQSSGERRSTYGPSGTTTGSSYGSPRSTASDSDFLASSLTSSTAGYSPEYGTGLSGTETGGRSSLGDLGGTSTSSGRSRESGSSEEV